MKSILFYVVFIFSGRLCVLALGLEAQIQEIRKNYNKLIPILESSDEAAGEGLQVFSVNSSDPAINVDRSLFVLNRQESNPHLSVKGLLYEHQSKHF